MQQPPRKAEAASCLQELFNAALSVRCSARVQASPRRGKDMPKYLVQASYTVDGVKGVQSAGGTARRDAVAKLAESVGGKLESFHFAFGETDAFVILDLPDNQSAAAASLAVSATGFAASRVVVLLTPEEVDEAMRRSPDYRAPGT